jgi:TetR/AcrR family transcriptional repressor of lmrAB and yxaGH operons
MSAIRSQKPGSKERILEAAIALMRRSGFSGAGINEIIKQSSAPKGSMYHYFPEGKRQIAGEALAIYSQRILDVLDQALSSAETPAGKIKSLFHVFAQRIERGEFRQSCAAGAVCLDLDEELDQVRLAIAGAFADWIKLIARHFEFEDKRRAKSFAGLVLTAIEGAYIRGRAEHSSKPFKEAGIWLAEVADREATG